MVDAATFIDPVVPVDSERAAGAVVKKGMRTLFLWYVGWVTHQMSQSASAVSRALHIVDDRLKELERAVEAQKVPDAGVVEFPVLAGPGQLVGRAGAGGVEQGAGPGAARGVRRRLAGAPDRRGRRGRLRRRPALPARRRGRARRAGPARRGRGRPPARGGGVGPGRHRAQRDGRGHGGRRAHAAAQDVASRLAPGGTLVIHSVARATWEAADAPSRPTWRPGARCGPTPGAISWPGRLHRLGGARPRGPRLPGHRRAGRGHAVHRATPDAVSAAAGRPVAVHQFLPALNPHDATGTHTLAPATCCAGRAGAPRSSPRRSTTTWRPRRTSTGRIRDRAAEGDVAVYQFTTSSSVGRIPGRAGAPADPRLPQLHRPRALRRVGAPERGAGGPGGRGAGPAGPVALLGLAHSSFSERTLREAGCRRTAVVPVLADYGRVTAEPDPRVLDELEELGAEGGADILFVGRVVPSKAQHELVKALWAYRRLYDARARLHLVGGTSSYEYSKSLQDFVDDLGLARAVRIAGEVSDASLAAYFAVADVFLSLSVHEGFGVPLVEAMSAGIPVVTLDAGAVSETVGDAALVLESADPAYVAAALHRVCTDDVLRHRLIEAGRSRAAALPGDGVATSSSRPSARRWAGREREAGRLRHPALRHAGHGRRRDGGPPAGRAPARPRPRGRPRSTRPAALNPHHLGGRARARHVRAQRRHGAPPPIGPWSGRGLLRARRPAAAGAEPDHAGAGAALGRVQRARSRPS